MDKVGIRSCPETAWDQADSADQYEAANIIKEAPVVSRSANDG